MGAFRVTHPFHLRALRRCTAASNRELLRHSLLQETVGSAENYCRCFSSMVETLFEYEREQVHDGGRESMKEAALNHALSQLASAGDFDKDSRLWLPRFFGSQKTRVISTGSLKLDLALGIGGLPKGRIVEIYGMEASGKTTLALHIIKEAQKCGGCCAYFDAENAIDPSLLDRMGIDTEKLLYTRPDCAENTLSVVNDLAKSGAVDIIVVDTVAALAPQCELANAVGATSEDAQSRLMTRALRKIHSSLSQFQTLVIFVNQVRSTITSGQATEVTCGGNALKFYAAIRLRTRKVCLLQSKEKVSGIGISVEVKKNKLASIMKDEAASALKIAGLNIEFGRGICCEAEVLDLASDHNLVSQEQNGFWVEGVFFRNRVEAEEYLMKNASLMEKLFRNLRMKLFRTT